MEFKRILAGMILKMHFHSKRTSRNDFLLTGMILRMEMHLKSHSNLHSHYVAEGEIVAWWTENFDLAQISLQNYDNVKVWIMALVNLES